MDREGCSKSWKIFLVMFLMCLQLALPFRRAISSPKIIEHDVQILQNGISRTSVPCNICQLCASSMKRQNAAIGGNKIPRFGPYENLASQWQLKGNFYLSAELLSQLNQVLQNTTNAVTYIRPLDSTTPYSLGTSPVSKINLYRDLVLAYFAHFHSLIRAEYQHEKDECLRRLTTFSADRLTREGYMVDNLSVQYLHTTYTEKTYRFYYHSDLASKYALNSFWDTKFATGDLILISPSETHSYQKSTPKTNSKNSIQGVVSKLHHRYIDILVSDSHYIEHSKAYRLDKAVSRTPYDRMLSALTLFCQESNVNDLSESVKDILLFTLPNSLLRLPSILANSSALLDNMWMGESSSPWSSNRRFNSIHESTSSLLLDRQASFSSLRWNDRLIHDKSSTNETLSQKIGQQCISTVEVAFKLVQETKLPFHSRKMRQLEVGARVFSQSSRYGRLTTPPPPIFHTNAKLLRMLRLRLSSLAFSPQEIDEGVRAVDFMLRVQNKLGLNALQQTAIRRALDSSVSLVLGPPGTGKTYTLCALLLTILVLHDQRGLRPRRIVATAHSHAAVDHMLGVLHGMLGGRGRGGRVIRVGAPRGHDASVRSDMDEYHLDALVDKDERVEAEVQRLDALLVVAKQDAEDAVNADNGGSRWSSQIEAQRRKLIAVRKDVAQLLLRDASVLFLTCLHAGAESLQELDDAGRSPGHGRVRGQQANHGGWVVVDEATQAPEPSLLPALLLAGRRGPVRLVLGGDPLQLPPTVLSPECQQGGLSVSMFERLLSAGLPATLLSPQYRMQASLGAVASELFYGGKVDTHVPALSMCSRHYGHHAHLREVFRPPCNFPVLPNASLPMVFFDTSLLQLSSAPNFGERESQSFSGSYDNPLEALLVTELVLSLLQPSASSHRAVRGVGILSPYNAQVRLLNQALQSKGVISFNGGWSDGKPVEIEIGSIDSFQGRETDIIVLSLVRANAKGQVGFLVDQRRLNVALTRARQLVVLVGDGRTLGRGGGCAWRRLLDYCRSRGVVVAPHRSVDAAEVERFLQDVVAGSTAA